MRPIYISYRPKDAETVELIAQRIMLCFGEHALQMNPTMSCPSNDRLDYHIESMMDGSEIILIVIGQDWSGLDEFGRFRLSSADVPIYYELKIALRGERKVIIVLIDNADIPPPNELPEEFHLLYDLQVVSLRPESFAEDLAKFLPISSLQDWFNYWFKGVWRRKRAVSELRFD